MGRIGCFETLVINYQSALRNIPEEMGFLSRGGGRVKSHALLWHEQKIKII
jgi:hypothetical protein